MSEYIKVSEAEGVRSIVFDRADKKNAITSDMYSAIAQALADGGADPDIAVFLILGSPGIFSAGTPTARSEASPAARLPRPCYRAARWSA